MKRVLIPSAAICSAVLSLGLMLGADKPATQPAGPSEADMQKMMEMMQPGAEHKRFEPLVGKFSAKSQWRMSEQEPWQSSEGESVNTMILGGRYLQQVFMGEMMGQPFKGLGMMGFDTMKKKYISLWMDEMSTSMMTSEGTADSAGKVLTFGGDMLCPMDGTMKPFHFTYTITDADNHSFEMFSPDMKTGKEFSGLKIVYTRVK